MHALQIEIWVVMFIKSVSCPILLGKTLAKENEEPTLRDYAHVFAHNQPPA